MKKLKVFSVLLACLLALAGNVWAGGRADNNAVVTATGLSLLDAIEQAADRITADLSPGSRVAVMDFEAGNDRLSDFIKMELTGALIERRIEVVARHSIEYIERELDFQMSGYVSDETALSIGKFVAAELLVTGQLTHLGSAYRFTATATRVQEATHVSAPRFDVRDDRAMQDMIAALNRQPAPPANAIPAVSEVSPPQSAGTFLDRGILFAMRGDYDMAIADFSEAIRLKPDMVGAYLLRGRALHASVIQVFSIGDNFSMISSVSTLGQTASDEQARILDRAIVDFTQAIRLELNNAMNYNERGSAYRDKGDYDRAIADFTQATRLNPNFAAAYNNLGSAYMQKRDYDQAITNYTQSIRFGPNFAGTYNSRGFAYAQKGDYDRAIEDYTQALRLDSNFGLAYENRGFAYYRKGNYDRAIEDYTQAIRFDPNYAVTYYNRGNAYYDKGDRDRAIADFDQAIRLD